VLTLRRCKTDQEGRGRKIGIPFGRDPELCPVVAVLRLLPMRPRGALFVNNRDNRLSGRALYKLIKKLCERTGADPESFSPHSLRAGFATAAAMAGKHERDIMRHTGHKSVDTLRRYIDDGTLFTDNPGDGIL
jgi:integrase